MALFFTEVPSEPVSFGVTGYLFRLEPKGRDSALFTATCPQCGPFHIEVQPNIKYRDIRCPFCKILIVS